MIRQPKMAILFRFDQTMTTKLQNQAYSDDICYQVGKKNNNFKVRCFLTEKGIVTISFILVLRLKNIYQPNHRLRHLPLC